MTGPHPLYRSLVRLYPSAFQHEYGEDLVLHYADLVADLGTRSARTRTALDLAVTIPRYHMERLMTEQHSATALGIVIALFAAGGVASVMTGVGSGSGLALFAIAGALAITQRSRLARALRVPDSNRRRRRLRTAATLSAVFVASFLAYLLLIGDSWTVRETVLATIGTLAMFGAPAYLIAGLLTPRSPDPARSS